MLARIDGRSLIAALWVILLSAPTLLAQTPRPDLQAMVELGREHDTAWGLYQALEEEAGGGAPLSWDNLPDWTGIYTRGGGFAFDLNQPPDVLTSARLTPEYAARFQELRRLRAQGIEYDPLSGCNPPGYPRWLANTDLREFVVTPDQTWLMNEAVNDVRRIYTDGREHTPEADRYPLWNGDSIGFWDGHRLIVHTNQLRAGQYQRGHPHHSDQIESVEIWQKVDERHVEVDVWIYDPPSLLEPWYTRQVYTRLNDPERMLRIRYWNCSENQNNTAVITEDGGTDLLDFTFTNEDDR